MGAKMEEKEVFGFMGYSCISVTLSPEGLHSFQRYVSLNESSKCGVLLERPGTTDRRKALALPVAQPGCESPQVCLVLPEQFACQMIKKIRI